MRATALISAIAVVLSISAGAAQATPLKFVLSGDYNYSWTLDSNPVPTGTNSNLSTYFASVPGVPANNLTFYVSGQGGLSAGTGTDDTVGTSIFDLTGPQIFGGTVNAPTFSTGVFQMDLDLLKNDGIPTTEILTISKAVAQTPIPGSLLLFASALGGLGFVGWRKHKDARAA